MHVASKVKFANIPSPPPPPGIVLSLFFVLLTQVEAHSPKDWTPELTKRLRDLVDELGGGPVA